MGAGGERMGGKLYIFFKICQNLIDGSSSSFTINASQLSWVIARLWVNPPANIAKNYSVSSI
jgi:hypothetical protein